MSAAALKLTAVETGYDRLRVLKGISLSVPDGTIVGIVGPNGHGKSTLLRAISGLVPLWSGQIFLSGVAIHNLPAHQRVATLSAFDTRPARQAWILPVRGYVDVPGSLEEAWFRRDKTLCGRIYNTLHQSESPVFLVVS